MHLIAMTTIGTGGVYQLVVVLHILAAIVGLGGVMLNGVAAQQAEARGGREGAAIMQAMLARSMVASVFILLVLIFGVILVLMEDALGFDQLWIWASIALFVVAEGVSHGVIRPNARRLTAAMGTASGEEAEAGGAPAPTATEVAASKRKLAGATMLDNLLTVGILFLMVWKPGI